MTKTTKLLAPLTALLFILAACGQPSTQPGGSGGSGSSGDEDVVSSNPNDDASNKEPGPGAKLVTPQGDAQNIIPGHWRRIKILDEDTLKVFTALALEPLDDSDPQGLQDLSWALDGILGPRCRAARTTVTHGRVACLVAHDAPETLARELLDELELSSQRPGPGLLAVRAGVGETVSV